MLLKNIDRHLITIPGLPYTLRIGINRAVLSVELYTKPNRSASVVHANHEFIWLLGYVFGFVPAFPSFLSFFSIVVCYVLMCALCPISSQALLSISICARLISTSPLRQGSLEPL